jgi:hypothetical protein
VRHLVDADREGDDQRVVLAGRDIDPVGVADTEPALRHLGDGVAAALDLVFVVDDVALASMSSPPSTPIENRSRNGVMRAFLTVATVWPARSIPIGRGDQGGSGRARSA